MNQIKAFFKYICPPQLWQMLSNIKKQLISYAGFFSSSKESKRRVYLNLLRKWGIRFVTVKANGCKTKINLNDSIISEWLFVYRQWEPYETHLISSLLRPDMIFIDIGAHIGYYSLLAAKILKGNGHVFSFEPAPENFSLLEQNITLNNFSTLIMAENTALSDYTGEVDLYMSDRNTGDHRIYPTDAKDDELFNAGIRRNTSVRVPVTTLDRYLENRSVKHVDLIKLDVQGAEMQVLQGMRNILLTNPHVILLTEFWPHGLTTNNASPQAMLDFIKSEIGLSIFQILPESRNIVPIGPLSEFVRRLENDSPLTQVDLLCCNTPESLLAISEVRNDTSSS